MDLGKRERTASTADSLSATLAKSSAITESCGPATVSYGPTGTIGWYKCLCQWLVPGSIPSAVSTTPGKAYRLACVPSSVGQRKRSASGPVIPWRPAGSILRRCSNGTALEGSSSGPKGAQRARGARACRALLRTLDQPSSQKSKPKSLADRSLRSPLAESSYPAVGAPGLHSPNSSWRVRRPR